MQKSIENIDQEKLFCDLLLGFRKLGNFKNHLEVVNCTRILEVAINLQGGST